MVNARQLFYAAWLLATSANAESSSASGTDSSSSSSSSSSSAGVIVLTGATEEATPTGSYITYSSTRTVGTSSTPITTSPLLSTITSGTETITTTVGSTTIFSYNTGDIVGNTTSVSGTPTSSQVFLSGSPKPTTNSTGTATSNTGPLPTCNQYAEFCDRSYGNITEVSAHNSPFVRANNAAANQAYDVTLQLDDGIRMLQGQIHWNDSVPHFCHTSCAVLDAGPITDYLTQVNDWVAKHPFDVVTILLENGDYRPVEDYVPYLQQTGLAAYAYTPPIIPMGKKDWPPLSHFILTGKRVIFFMDYNANQTSVPWIMDEFSQVWETPFDPVDRTFPCDVQRPPGLSPEDAKQRLYLTNHNLNYDINLLGSSLLVPNIPLLNVTNNVTGVGSLGAGTADCDKMWGYPPKFLNVDYYNIPNGSVFEVAAQWNNVTYNRTCCGVATSDSMRLGGSSGHNAIFSTALVMVFFFGML